MRSNAENIQPPNIYQKNYIIVRSLLKETGQNSEGFRSYRLPVLSTPDVAVVVNAVDSVLVLQTTRVKHAGLGDSWLGVWGTRTLYTAHHRPTRHPHSARYRALQI